MSHPRRPRSTLGQLIDAAKRRSGREWPSIDVEAGLTKSTREAWINGRVSEPGVYALLRLARVLGISAREIEQAVMDEQLPAWANGSLAARAHAHDVDAVAEATARKAARRAVRPQPPRRRNGPERA